MRTITDVEFIDLISSPGWEHKHAVSVKEVQPVMATMHHPDTDEKVSVPIDRIHVLGGVYSTCDGLMMSYTETASYLDGKPDSFTLAVGGWSLKLENFEVVDEEGFLLTEEDLIELMPMEFMNVDFGALKVFK